MGRKSRRKRLTREQETKVSHEAWNRLVKKAASLGIGETENFRQICRGSSTSKLSDCVLLIAKQAVGDIEIEDEDTFAELVEYAILAWNLSIVPRNIWPQSFGDGSKLGTGIWTVIEALIELKNQLFPEDKRLILSYEIVNEGRGRHLNVLYADGRAMEKH